MAFKYTDVILQLLLVAAAFLACSGATLPPRWTPSGAMDCPQEQKMRISIEAFQAAAVSVIVCISPHLLFCLPLILYNSVVKL